MKFLISRLSALGDTVCTLPAASSLKHAFPDCHITWLVEPYFVSVVECCGSVDKVLPYKFDKKLKRVDIEGEFDVALDLQGLLKSWYPIAWAKAKRKVGYHWQREGANFITQKVLPDPTSFHVVDQYLDVARAVGGATEVADFNFRPKAEALSSCQEKLTERGVGSRYAVVNPSAGWVTKRWPPDRFAELIELMNCAGVQTVLIGGKSDSDRACSAAVVAAAKCPVVDLSGQTSVAELIALISMSAVHIGGDTGSSHIAAALKTPAVGLYSITNPLRSCPYGQRSRCHYAPGGLAEIDPADVFKTVEAAL